MPRTTTSADSPLRIAEVPLGDGRGRIGITLCPGKTQPDGMAGAWERSLCEDLDVVRDWGATAVVTLITDAEIRYLQVEKLGKEVRDRHLEWWHLPIPDGEPPESDFEIRWKVAGEALRDRLRLGFDVLVHCRGGLGRAGTVAARLLVELGARPDEAIRRVREARPGAIESSQEPHLLRCRVEAPAVPATTEDAIRDRALGAFLGLAAGDALGTTLEFSARDTKPRLTDIEGGGPFGLPPGCWTDDTAMALALAESLAASGTLAPRDLMDRFVKWRNGEDYCPVGSCFDIGETTEAAIERYRRSGDPFAGSADPQTAGNGSLMRLAPVALRFWSDRARLVETAADQSRTTHGAAEAVDSCRAFAELMADAIAGSGPRADLLAPRPFEGEAAITRIMAGSWRGRARESIVSSGYVVATLEAAIWSVARTSDFRLAVLLAANLGDDADTVAAVTGQLAGALYGVGGIPGEWIEKIAWKDRLLEAGERLVAASFADRKESGAPPRSRRATH